MNLKTQRNSFGSAQVQSATRSIVLMYHAVLRSHDEWVNEPSADRWYAILEDQFKHQMEYLVQKRFETASLRDFVEGKTTPGAVVLTFDDGHESNYRVAFPILKRLGLCAEFFVTVGNIGKPKFVTWQQLEEMQMAGMSVQSHGWTHRKMTSLSRDELTIEFENSKRELDSRLGARPRFYAIPGGFADERVYELGLAAGYRAICNSEPCLALPSEIIPRMAITHSTTLAGFGDLVQQRPMTLFRMSAQRQFGKAAKALVGVERYEAMKKRALKG